MQNKVTQRLLNTGELLRILNIPNHKLDYLFKSRRLQPEDFITLNNGHRIYRESDLPKIKEALFSLQR